MLKYFLSSDCFTTQAGKCITIYPKNDKLFKNIVLDLADILIGFEGPVVISDMQYRDTNIFYRYGVMAAQSDYLLIGGTPIMDNRSFFELPNGIEDPFENINDEYHNVATF